MQAGGSSGGGDAKSDTPPGHDDVSDARPHPVRTGRDGGARGGGSGTPSAARGGGPHRLEPLPTSSPQRLARIKLGARSARIRAKAQKEAADAAVAAGGTSPFGSAGRPRGGLRRPRRATPVADDGPRYQRKRSYRSARSPTDKPSRAARLRERTLSPASGAGGRLEGATPRPAVDTSSPPSSPGIGALGSGGYHAHTTSGDPARYYAAEPGRSPGGSSRGSPTKSKSTLGKAMNFLRSGFSSRSDLGGAQPPADGVLSANIMSSVGHSRRVMPRGHAPAQGLGVDGQGSVPRSPAESAKVEDLLRKRRALALAITGATSLYQGQQFRQKVLGKRKQEKRRVSKTPGRLMIHPHSFFTGVWEALFLMFLCYVTVRVPFFIAFTRTSEWYTVIADACSTVFFILDIILTFFMCYYDDGDLVVDRREVAWHYFTGWLTYDVIASFPWTALFPDEPRMRVILLLRLVRLAKLETIMDRVVRKWDVGEIAQLWLRVATLGFYIVVTAHISGCAWFFIASKIDFHDENSWTTLADISTSPSLSTQYMSSLYWSFTTLTTVGYGDISAHTQWERGFSIIMLLVGAAVFAMLVGKMSALSTERNSRVIELRKRQALLDEFLRHSNLPRTLRVRVREYSEYMSRKHKFNNEQDELLEDLSPALRRAVNRYIYQGILNSVPVFRFGSTAFRTTLAKLLQPVLAVKDEFIIIAEDAVREMYFVREGTVQVIGRMGHVLLELQDGSFFGEVNVLEDKPATASVRAMTECDMFMLSKDDLDTVLESFPEFESMIRKLAELRNSNAVKPKPGDPKVPPPDGFFSWREVTAANNFDRFYNEQMKASRAMQAAKYKPQPRSVATVRLSSAARATIDIIANQAHDEWAARKMERGWKQGLRHNPAKKMHPDLLPYPELPDAAKASGRQFAEYVVKILQLMNYRIVQQMGIDEAGNEVEGVDAGMVSWKFGDMNLETRHFEPRPFPIERVELPKGVEGVVDTVAKQLHEFWAHAKVEAGWRWAARNNDAERRDSALLPWEYLTPREKKLDQETVEGALKLLVGHGYQFLHGRRTLIGVSALQRLAGVRARSDVASTGRGGRDRGSRGARGGTTATRDRFRRFGARGARSSGGRGGGAREGPDLDLHGGGGTSHAPHVEGEGGGGAGAGGAEGGGSELRRRLAGIEALLLRMTGEAAFRGAAGTGAGTGTGTGAGAGVGATSTRRRALRRARGGGGSGGVSPAGASGGPAEGVEPEVTLGASALTPKAGAAPEGLADALGSGGEGGDGTGAGGGGGGDSGAVARLGGLGGQAPDDAASAPSAVELSMVGRMVRLEGKVDKLVDALADLAQAQAQGQGQAPSSSHGRRLHYGDRNRGHGDDGGGPRGDYSGSGSMSGSDSASDVEYDSGRGADGRPRAGPLARMRPGTAGSGRLGLRLPPAAAAGPAGSPMSWYPSQDI